MGEKKVKIMFSGNYAVLIVENQDDLLGQDVWRPLR